MDRFLTIHKFGDADAEDLGIRLRAMTGRESLSELFSFRLFADLPQDKVADLSAEDILGKRIVLSLYQPDSSPVFFSGIVSSMSLGNVSKDNRRSCNLEVVPELWKLTETLDTRRHPSDKVVDLVASILDERKLDLKLVNLVASNDKRHPGRVNPVQYEESYYSFLVRHMKEEGIYFYHREQYTEKDGEVQGDQTLVLGDDPRGFFTPDPVLDLRFQLMENTSNLFDVRSWDRQFKFKPAKWTVNDFDYQKAGDFAMTRGGDSGEKPYRKFKSHAGFYSKDYADHMLANLAEKEDVSREYILATSDCPHLAPGCRFNLKGHPVKSENGEYIVTTVEHRAFDDLYSSGAETEYENRFTCVPANRVPTICPHSGGGAAAGWPSSQAMGRSAGAAFDSSTAFVDFEFDGGTLRGTNNNFPDDKLSSTIVAETAWVVDSQGRHNEPTTKGKVHARQQDGAPSGIAEVQIKYSWETTDPADNSGKSLWQSTAEATTSTRWVRVSQLAAGQDWGTKFIPRVGEEVVVLYLDGEKKKPVIIGSLFNSENKTKQHADRKTDAVNIVKNNQGGSGPPDAAFTRAKPYGVADNPGGHDLVEGINPNARDVPNLRDDDVSGIRTRSGAISTNDEKNPAKRYNEILFKDKTDHEELYMHAAKDFNVDVEGNMNIVVKGDVNEIVHGKYYRSVNLDHDEGPVNRSIVGGASFDLDKVWEYKSIEINADYEDEKSEAHTEAYEDALAEGMDHMAAEAAASAAAALTRHPYKVKTEIYADTETSAKGDVKEVQWGTTSSYFLGNTWTMNIAAAESLTLGFTLDIFVGAKMEFCAALAFSACAAASIELTAAAKLEISCGPTLDKSPVSVEYSELDVNSADVSYTKTKLSLRKDKLHVVEADVIVFKGKLIVFEADQIIEKGVVYEL